MDNQILATFYVELSQEPTQTVSAEVQCESYGNWTRDMATSYVSNFAVDATVYNNNPRQYKIDVRRTASQVWDNNTNDYVDYYYLYAAGIYPRKLVIKHGNEVLLERMIYITIQPDVQITRKDGKELLTREEDEDSKKSNPLNIQRTIALNESEEAMTARNILIDENSKYRDDITIKSNLPIDVYGNDLETEITPPNEWTTVSTWLRLAEKIRMIRQVGSTNYKWSGYLANPPIIRQNEQEKYTTFISSYNSDFSSDTNLLDIYGSSAPEAVKPVTLRLEKPLFALPLLVESNFRLLGRAVDRYTGTGTNTESIDGFTVPFNVTLTTPLQVKISPEILTLDDDNNFTSFITVEANDEVSWKLTTPNTNKLTLPSLASGKHGTGRAAVIVKGNTSFTNTLQNNCDTAVLTADVVGGYTKTDSSVVRLESYTPTINALIPKQTTGAFNHSLSDLNVVGQMAIDDMPNDDQAVVALIADPNDSRFPKLEGTLPSGLHRIRSWSLQSVGTYTGLTEVAVEGGTVTHAWSKRVAKVLALQGQTSDNKWKTLDVVDLDPGGYGTFYRDTKPREDRVVLHQELVKKIRVVVLATFSSNYNGHPDINPSANDVWIPQIQVFAGEPVMPKMSGNSHTDFTINAPDSIDGSAAAWKIFDRAVGGGMASVGNGSWYINLNAYPNDGVAASGAREKVSENDLKSMRYLTIKLPRRRLLGYLYSVDVASLPTGDQKKAFAASIYFEGRTTYDKDANDKSSSEGQWDEVGLISLDKCIGHSPEETAFAINQATLDGYANSVLKLTANEIHNAYFVNRNGKKIYLCTSGTWTDIGNWFTDANDPIGNTNNKTHYADFETIRTLEHFRLTVKSLMNIWDSPNSTPVLMPEMQFFGLPNATNTGTGIATVTYLKAEDDEGNMYDILGRHQQLPFLTSNSTNIRVYWGEFANIDPNRQTLYFDCWSAKDERPRRTQTEEDNKGVSINDYNSHDTDTTYYARTTLHYYEMYIYSIDDEKVILSSGYIGGQL